VSAITLALMLAGAQVAPTASLPAPAIPPATIDNTLEIEGESVAAKVIDTRMAVDVQVNGQGPFRFIVDSGADRTVIGAALARRLNLPAGKPVRLNSMAGALRVETVELENVMIGTSAVPNILAPALPEQNIGAQGLIGIDALAEQRLLMDFEQKTVTVQDARRQMAAQDGEIVVTARRRNGQLILTEVTVADRAIYAVIDSGAQVTVGNSALLERLKRTSRLPVGRPLTLISVTGQTLEAMGYLIPEIRIGGITAQNVEVAFVDAQPFALFGLDKQPALLIGTDLLGYFRRVALDFRNRKVRFVLPRGLVRWPDAIRRK
jgi:predicted aspartyl protease